MIIQDIHAKIDIVGVAEWYTKLTKSGSNYTGSCPLHKEKTPSFMVSPAKNIFKCFGCGAGGDAITLVQKAEGLDFKETLKFMAKKLGISYDEKQATPEQIEKQNHLLSLKGIMKKATEIYAAELNNYPEVKEYAIKRFGQQSIEKYDIGFAPNEWHFLMQKLGELGYKLDLIKECGLIATSNNKDFDFFRNRLMIPVRDEQGNVITFAGRAMENDAKPKYLNGPETIMHIKSKTLFNLNNAKQQIREKSNVYVVEGHADVIKLDSLGVENVVSGGGTSFTIEQAKLLQKYTNTITGIPDGDDAGVKAIDAWAEKIITQGMNFAIVPLPYTKDKKTDPDSEFNSIDDFQKYKNKNSQDYIFYRAEQIADKVKNWPGKKLDYIKDMCGLLKFYSEDKQAVYVEHLSKKIKPKKAWTDQLKEINQDNKKEDKAYNIPADVKLDDFETYGFYASNNCYYFRNIKGLIYKASNFIMMPLFHVESIINSKRLFLITNEFHLKRIIELSQKDLISLSAFKLRVESLGNFVWLGTEIDLNRLKMFLYENTQSCIEVEQLGWQPKQKVWVWANGIFNGEFIPTSEMGIVQHNNINYYIPAYSNIYNSEDKLYVAEKKFIHLKGTISMEEYTKELVKVYGNNAVIGFCYYIATLFRDWLVAKNNFYPILNLFGPKGAGKTEMAVSLLQLFGHLPKGPNINSTSKPALADHISQFHNSLCHIDEYKNNLEFEKIEFLKGVWDGTGRTRMNMDKDKKKETTAVDCGLMLTGQEMPTADVALYSRLIFLTFTQYEYTDKEKENFNNLKDIERKGLTHITEELLHLRHKLIEKYDEKYSEVASAMLNKINNATVEDRIWKNWMIPIAVFASIEEQIKCSFNLQKVMDITAECIVRQNSEIKKSNELAVFFGLIEYMATDKLIEEEFDFKFQFTINASETMELKTPRTILYLNISRVIPLYRKYGHQMKENVLPVKTLEYYLRNDKSFVGMKVVKFKYHAKVIEENSMTCIREQYKSMRVMGFDYETLKNVFSCQLETNNIEKEETEEAPF